MGLLAGNRFVMANFAMAERLFTCLLVFLQILQGNYLFGFGDHGGIIVAAKYYRVGDATNELIFSIDEGETWHNYTFSDQKVRVLGLMTEPGENTTVFFIFASSKEQNARKHSWILIKVDFRDVFGKYSVDMLRCTLCACY